MLQRDTENDVWIQEDMPKLLKEDLRILMRVAKQAASLNKEEYSSIRVKDFRLHFNGESYKPSDLESLPHDLCPSTLCTTWSDEVVVFFGRHSPLSNHHLSPFTINNTPFANVEQYLAVARARLAGDDEILERALSCTNPTDCKGILNALKEDHIQEWEDARAPLLMKALGGKFNQNRRLGDYLRSTFPRRLGEASRDTVWGIGIGLGEEGAMLQSSWHAEGNLLGKSLSTIRDELIRDFGPP